MQGNPPDCPPPPVAKPSGGNTGNTGNTGNNGNNGNGNNGNGNNGGTTTPEQVFTELDERVQDYNEALRVASVKLVGDLPTLDQIYRVADADEVDKATEYEQIVDEMLLDPRFAEEMIKFYRYTFHMYGLPTDFGADPSLPSRETAPTFAARVLVEGQPWTTLLTQSSNTCPTWDMNSQTFVDGDCSNVATLAADGKAPAGLLTDPGIMSVFFGNLALRRNRFFHETFLCRFANNSVAEPTDTPYDGDYCIGTPEQKPVPDGYASPWPLDVISGDCIHTYVNGEDPEEHVNFHEYNATVICANCHTTWNHRAPMWAMFDELGMHVPDADTGAPGQQFAVHVPVNGEPFAERVDWLPASEGFAWKKDMPVVAPNGDYLTALGQVMVQDDEVLACAVKRMWNFAMSRGDIVENEAEVPNSVIEPQEENWQDHGKQQLVTAFKSNGFNLRATLKQILLHDDFTRF